MRNVDSHLDKPMLLGSNKYGKEITGQRFFNMFINVRLNRENALDTQPTRDRVKSTENLRYWSGEPNQESNSLSKQRQT